MGLKNVNERLKLLYGENYKINIETLPNKGTKVSFSIPIEEGGLYSK
jgi:two-component system, LytTR family, sensor kinase